MNAQDSLGIDYFMFLMFRVQLHASFLTSQNGEKPMQEDYCNTVAEQSRRSHIAAVLSEQWMQKQNGICDGARLSSVSQNSSCRSAEKARKLAMGYAALMIE
jgi:hypothetical protein